MNKERKQLDDIDTTPTWEGILPLMASTLYKNNEDEVIIEELIKMGKVAGVDTSECIVDIVSKDMKDLQPTTLAELVEIAKKADENVVLIKRNQKINKIKSRF